MSPATGAAPEQLGPFELLRPLGQGGSAEVFAARVRAGGPAAPAGLAPDGEVALKIGRRADEAARFLGEAALCARVDHPAVVRVLASGTLPDGRPYLVMPLLRGESMATALARGPLALAVALAHFRAIAAGVAALHEAGLLHRDLKAENVILDDGRPVIVDLGIAKDERTGPSTETREGVVRGTPATMAPERFFGQPASVASDVYELGLLLYQMIAGRPPWEREEDVDERLAARPLSTIADVPEALSEAVMQALASRPERRPVSVAALAERVAVGAAGARAGRRTTAATPFSVAPPRSAPGFGATGPGSPSTQDRVRAESAPPTRRGPESETLEPVSRPRPAPPSRRRLPARRVWLVAGLVGVGGVALGLGLARLPGGASPTAASAGAGSPLRPTPSDTDASLAAQDAPRDAASAISSEIARTADASASAHAGAAAASASGLPASSPVAGAGTSAAVSAAPFAPGALGAEGVTVAELEPGCAKWVAYTCEFYGPGSMCSDLAASLKRTQRHARSPEERAAFGASCEKSLREAIARDEPVRTAKKAIDESPTCSAMVKAACSADIVGDPVTKPFCDQGTVMARALVLSATKEQAEAGCKQFQGDLPALVSQRRAQKRGDAQAQTDVLEKYGLHKMP